MTDKEKEEARFLMDGVTVDEKIKEGKKKAEEICRRLKEQQKHD